ncbi:MAG TPA: hypothetical protein VGR84_12160, partial [Candidatus Acidoferrales bacterium]|nr:hypothetical protein [Candidatus Acidoferrales bacterium]
VFGIKPECCSASNRNSVRDHRNAVRDQTGTVFGIARIPQFFHLNNVTPLSLDRARTKQILSFSVGI